jgi:hypothetical protein
MLIFSTAFEVRFGRYSRLLASITVTALRGTSSEFTKPLGGYNKLR